MTNTARDLGPNNAYIGAVGTVRSLLARIAATIDDDNSDPDHAPRTWGEAGDMLHLQEELQQISDRIHHEGEYATIETSGIVKRWNPTVGRYVPVNYFAEDGSLLPAKAPA